MTIHSKTDLSCPNDKKTLYSSGTFRILRHFGYCSIMHDNRAKLGSPQRPGYAKRDIGKHTRPRGSEARLRKDLSKCTEGGKGHPLFLFHPPPPHLPFQSQEKRRRLEGVSLGPPFYGGIRLVFLALGGTRAKRIESLSTHCSHLSKGGGRGLWKGLFLLVSSPPTL